MPLSVLQRLDVPSEFLKRVSDGATLQAQPIQARMQHLAITKAKSKTVAKLVQSSQSYSFMTCGEDMDDFHSHRASQLTWIQLTESTNGECALKGEQIRNGITSHVGVFEFRSRNVIYDGASSFPRKERGWAELHKGFSLFFSICQLHSLANDQKDTFLKKADVRENLRSTGTFARVVNKGTLFLNFSDWCRRVIRHLARVKEGPPPRDSQLYKSHLMRLTLASGTRIIEKLACLKSLPNGDWQPLGVITIWVPVGSSYSVEQIVFNVAVTTSSMLCGSRFTRWREARWMGADTAYDEQILMEGINGLQTLTFLAYHSAQLGYPVEACLKRVDDFIEAMSRPHLLALAGPLDAPPDVSLSGGAGGRANVTEQHEDEERRVSILQVLRFLFTRPSGTYIVIRQALEIFVRIMRLLLWWSSAKFEKAQVMKEKKATHDEFAPRRLERTFPVLEAAKGVLDEKLHGTAQHLLEQEQMWCHIMPPRDQTVAMCNLAFELISGVECSAAHSVGMQNRRSPTRIFKLLVSVDEARALDALKPFF